MQGTKTTTTPTDLLLKSVDVIESAWIRYRNRRIFRLLKHSICAAEDFMSEEILRRICPTEARLLNDPCVQVKVRLRFGGSNFPPLIFFKIFLCNKNGKGVKYITGKRMIRPESDAARSACNLMGARVYYDQLTVDMLMHQTHGFTDEIDVTTLKDYKKFSSVLDETPASLGGRENLWRQLTLEALPRHVMFYDVVDYIYNRKLSPALRREMQTLLRPPVNQHLQLEHINILTKYRNPPPAVTRSVKSARSVDTPTSTAAGVTSRRSTKARQRAAQLRAAYLHPSTADSNFCITVPSASMPDASSSRVASPLDDDVEDVVDDGEAYRLYEWAQSLNLEEVQPSSTRVRSS